MDRVECFPQRIRFFKDCFLLLSTLLGCPEQGALLWPPLSKLGFGHIVTSWCLSTPSFEVSLRQFLHPSVCLSLSLALSARLSPTLVSPAPGSEETTDWKS